MKLKLLSATILAITLAGCQVNQNDLVGLGVQSAQIASLSDSEVKTLSDKSCAEMDANAKIAPDNNAYTVRLKKIMQPLGDNINGTAINYKVYLTDDVNAWAMANGCVRVYSGLMDKMTDNEVQGVLGHELGHVALGHSKKAMQVSYGTQITRGVIAAVSNSTIANLTQSQLGDLAEGVINAQFSQKQETEADNYSFDLLVKKGINPLGLATAFEKLGGGEASLLSTHPASSDRAKNIREKIAQRNQNQ
ncbi:putative metalloprotease [Orbus hercynius]|uniref:Putative metalloprotease n=1 Tax=Orbus hercynius TaxID=593135 RepID=A0A495RB03_9GAMM|nr:M48 family metallopeptidase [Orbus hercynius]RKS84456.1 putative metalloprotease [Orbus hercynius]